jgi:glycosyltransferase involved in cell wall biosynthesis
MTATDTLITVIIPTYNRSKQLKRAINSVLNQTFTNFIISVCDNASDDDTAGVVREMVKNDSRITYHRHEKNMDWMYNFNFGLKNVKTPFFCLIPDDDLILPDFFETALEGFKKFPEAAMSICNTLTITDDYCEDPLTRWEEGYFNAPDGFVKILENGHALFEGILFRKEIIEKIGLLDKDVNTSADLDYELRVAAKFPLVISNKPCALYLRHSLSRSNRCDIYDIWPGEYVMIKKLCSDTEIPVKIRDYAKLKLMRRLKNSIFQKGLKSVLSRNYSNAYQASSILDKGLKDKVRSVVLFYTTRFCEFAPQSIFFVNLSYRALCYYKIINVKVKSQNFREYKEYLKES